MERRDTDCHCMTMTSACEKAVCAKCSPNTLMMPRCFGYGPKPQRVCANCESTVRDYTYRPEFEMTASELETLSQQRLDDMVVPRRRVIGCTSDHSKFDDVRGVLMRAFFDDPVIVYAFPDTTQRNESMRRFFSMWQSLAERCTTNDERDNVQMVYDSTDSSEHDGARHAKGVSLWFPPGAHPSTWQMIASGTTHGFAAFGIAAGLRLISLAGVGDIHDEFVRVSKLQVAR